MSNDTYNGWANKPTWLVNLWMTNDEGGEAWLREQVEQAIDDSDGDRDDAVSALADALEEQHAEYAGDHGPQAGVMSDLLSWALAMVNWREIAESHIDDAWPADTGPDPDAQRDNAQDPVADVEGAE